MANYDPVKISLDDKPRAIVRAMDALTARPVAYTQFSARRRLIPRIVALAGVVLIVVDLLSGFGSHLLLCPVVPLWIAAVIMWLSLYRGRPRANFSPRYQVAREIIQTLRDDLHPDRNLFGTLDLTGLEKPEKIARTTKNALGLDVGLYRDEWLSLKTKLYDGNMLRLAAIERAKVRLGYSKRSRVSGKLKWKPPRNKGNEQQLKVTLSVNPELYEISVPPPHDQVGRYKIDALDTEGGIVTLLASSADGALAASDILGVLHFMYSLLHRKGTPA
jgi:hypothetical protein